MITAEIIKDNDKIDYIPILGGLRKPVRWRKYLSLWMDKRYPIAIKNAIILNNLVGVCANRITDHILFSFSDGSKPIGFSWRAWGDLMDAIVGKKEGYMTYYMS